jgi:galactokinase
VTETVLVRAPGRVNLIGDHTDYQDGWCLPIAIDREVRLAASARADGAVTVTTDELDGTVVVPAHGGDDPRRVEPAWGRTVAAVLARLAARHRAPVGFDATVTSTVPLGAGLSSSAAFEVAVALAAGAVADDVLPGDELARAAQEAEHLASGVPCGPMDQLASVYGRQGHALLIDCRSRAVEPVPLPAAVEVVVVHSGLPRRLESSAYARRRAACERAAARLGVPSLRDAHPRDVADDPIARHVVSENARVLACADALRGGDVEQVGRLMVESHASLCDDYEVSTPELDRLVELALAEGALGARLTGAGFGGCIVALVASSDDADALGTAVASRYGAVTGLTASAFTVHAADGAAVVART